MAGGPRVRHYGTPEDGEYLPLGVGRLRTLVGYLAEIALLPLAAGHVIPLGWPMQLRLYLLALLPLALNHVRTLAAHRYRSVGERMTLAEQLDDSINVEGRTPLAALLFPVGLRYHALHHLFPSIPYHALATAHARIVRELPDWHAYRRATYPSFGAAVADLRRGMREACEVSPPGEDRWFARLRADASGRRSRPAGLAGDS